jgi:hypothetical protein
MRRLVIAIMKNRLIEKIEVDAKKFDKTKTIEVLKKDLLPDLKDINPTKEEIDYFFTNIVTIDQHQREFDCLIGKL